MHSVHWPAQCIQQAWRQWISIEMAPKITDKWQNVVDSNSSYIFYC